jgi:hypothetical protein
MTLLAIDLERSDIFPVAQWAKVALFKPKPNAGRVVDVPAVELCVGQLFQANTASDITDYHF